MCWLAACLSMMKKDEEKKELVKKNVLRILQEQYDIEEEDSYRRRSKWCPRERQEITALTAA